MKRSLDKVDKEAIREWDAITRLPTPRCPNAGKVATKRFSDRAPVVRRKSKTESNPQKRGKKTKLNIIKEWPGA